MASLSFYSSLPSTGIDVALVGPSDLCQPLAAALLRIFFDRPSQNRPRDAAVQALANAIPTCSNPRNTRRHVYTVEDLEHLPDSVRMDHIVLVVSPKGDPHATRQKLQDRVKQLDEAYVGMHRCSIVIMMDPHHGTRDMESCIKRRGALSGVAVFPCQLQRRASHRSVARLLLQRAKLGTRRGSRHLTQLTPLVI